MSELEGKEPEEKSRETAGAEPAARPLEGESANEPGGEAPADATSQGDLFTTNLTDERLRSVLESLIFNSSHPISALDLCRVLWGTPRERVRAMLKAMTAEGEEKAKAVTSGFVLREVAGGYQYRTIAENAHWLKKLQKQRPWRLTQASLETLAIVAYKQPLTRGEIDETRGVDSSAVVVKLLEKRLIKPVGRKEVPGYPMMYGTTPAFLEFFGLKDLRDLPTLKEIKDMNLLEEATQEIPEEARAYLEEQRLKIEREQDAALGIFDEEESPEAQAAPAAEPAPAQAGGEVSYESLSPGAGAKKPEEGEGQG